MVEENFVVRARRYIAGWISPGPAPENPGNSPVEREAALAGNHTRYLTVAVQDLQNGRTVFEAGVLRALEGYQANVLEELGRFRADQTAHTERLDKRYADHEARTDKTLREGLAEEKGYTDRQVADSAKRLGLDLGERIEVARTEASEATGHLRAQIAEQVGGLRESQAATDKALAETNRRMLNAWREYNSRAGITGPIKALEGDAKA